MSSRAIISCRDMLPIDFALQLCNHLAVERSRKKMCLNGFCSCSSVAQAFVMTCWNPSILGQNFSKWKRHGPGDLVEQSTIRGQWSEAIDERHRRRQWGLASSQARVQSTRSIRTSVGLSRLLDQV